MAYTDLAIRGMGSFSDVKFLPTRGFLKGVFDTTEDDMTIDQETGRDLFISQEAFSDATISQTLAKDLFISQEEFEDADIDQEYFKDGYTD